MDGNALKLLEAWYARQCNGEWEHTYGVLVETLDNPGWRVRVDLAETSLDGASFEAFKRETSEQDWIHVRIEDGAFVGYGGSRNLIDIVSIFTDWMHSVERSS